MVSRIPGALLRIWRSLRHEAGLTPHHLSLRHGQVLSVRVLYERRCAFVNYTRPESAAAALKKLQGHTVGDCCLLLRYPENNTTKSSAGHPPQPSGPPR